MPDLARRLQIGAVKGQPTNDAPLADHLRQNLQIAQAILQCQHTPLFGEHPACRLGRLVGIVAIYVNDRQIHAAYLARIRRRRDFGDKLPVQPLHVQTLLLHRLHMLLPHVDQGHLLASSSQIRPV